MLPTYAEKLGVGAFGIGLITAFYALGLVLFLPLWGWISDRIGRRPVILVSLLGTAFSFVLLAIAHSLGTALFARFLGGFFGASIGTAQAAMTDLTDESSRAQGMGVIGAASGIGLVLGTALGGLLGSIDPALPFYATAAVAAAELRARRVRAAGVEGAGRRASTSWRGFAHAVVPEPLQAVASVHDRGSSVSTCSSSCTSSSRSRRSSRCSRCSPPRASAGARCRRGCSWRRSRSCWAEVRG